MSSVGETAPDTDPTSNPPGTPVRRSRARMLILLLISIGTMINYLDRTVISVAAPAMSKDLGLNDVWMGVVFSIFSWTYVAAQIPGGAFIDRIGVRLAYFWSMAVWSLFTLLQGLSTGLYSLLAYRLGLGIAEAPCFPANSRILSTWFPQHERARATSAFTVGEYFGLAFFSPLLFWIVVTLGWRSLFVITGVIGLAFAVVWIRSYRDPHHSKRVNQAELDYIEAGGGLGHENEAVRFDWRNVGRLLRKRQILGAAIGQFGGNSTLVFFLTWFPTYLITQRHMEWLNAGFFVVMPFIAASVGLIAGGWLSDRIIARTGNASMGRKLPILSGLVLAATIVSANYVASNTVVDVVWVGWRMGQHDIGFQLAIEVDQPLIELRRLDQWVVAGVEEAHLGSERRGGILGL